MNIATQSLHGRVSFKGLVHKVKADVLKAGHKLRDPEADVTPRMYAYVPSDKILVIADMPMELFDPRTRHGIPHAVASFVRLTNANLVAVQWTAYELNRADLSDEDKADYDDATKRGTYGRVEPQDHPKSQEVVMATVIDAEIIQGWWCPITRTESRPPRFGPWYTKDRRYAVGGKMLDPIQEALR